MKVTAIRVVTDRDGEGREVQYTDTVIVELPEEKDLRQSLFDLDRREAQEEYGSAEEMGQRYFMMWWD